MSMVEPNTGIVQTAATIRRVMRARISDSDPRDLPESPEPDVWTAPFCAHCTPVSAEPDAWAPSAVARMSESPESDILAPTEPTAEPAAAPTLACFPGSMRNVPCSMFIPHAKGYSPGSSGCNVSVVVRKAGSARSTPKSEKTTCDEHSPSSLRSKISRNGTPASASMTAGLYPPLTSTTASCTPSRNGARYALRGAKKNHSTPAVTSSAIISAIAMCIFQPPSVRNWLSISANTITIYPYRVYWQEGRANFSRR